MGSTHVVLLMNREKFDSLPDDVQEVFLRHGVAAAENNCAWMAENDSLVRDKMVDEAGLEVVKLGAEETARWKERTDAVAADWAASVGEHGAEAVEAYTAAVGRLAAKN